MSGSRLCNKLVVDYRNAMKILGKPKPVCLITSAGPMILNSPSLDNGFLTGKAIVAASGNVISAVSINPEHVVAFSFDFSETEFEKLSAARTADKEDDDNE